MFEKHKVIVLPQIPRERDTLQQLINQARHDIRVRMIKSWISVGCFIIGSILFTSTCGHPATEVKAKTPHAIFLPIIQS